MTNTPWVIRPATGDGFAITYRTEREVKRIRAETREDLESLRDLLTEYLAPDELATPAYTHIAVFNVADANGAMGWGNLPVAIKPGGLGLDGLGKISDEARAKFPRAHGVVLVNLIPLGSA